MTSKAIVTCRDGKQRVFESSDYMCAYKFRGTKYLYRLMTEESWRGFITMMYQPDCLVLALAHMQPVRIEAETPEGKWVWEKVVENEH
jgi:hypothetical protein